MNKSYSRLIVCTVVASVMLLAYPAMNFPQARENLIASIVLRITTPKGRLIKAQIIEGKMITIVDSTTRSGYGFIPAVQSTGSRFVEVKMFRITGDETSAPVEVESAETKVGEQRQFGGIPFEVKVIAIVYDFKEDMPSPSSPGCCVDCDGERVCASCMVITDCGCCFHGCSGQCPING